MQLKVPPDWNVAPDLSRSFTVIVKRNPKVLEAYLGGVE